MESKISFPKVVKTRLETFFSLTLGLLTVQETADTSVHAWQVIPRTDRLVIRLRNILYPKSLTPREKTVWSTFHNLDTCARITRNVVLFIVDKMPAKRTNTKSRHTIRPAPTWGITEVWHRKNHLKKEKSVGPNLSTDRYEDTAPTSLPAGCNSSI